MFEVYAQVIVDIASSNVDKIFDYYIEDDVDMPVGSRVLVPFGNRKIEGFIISKSNTTSYEKTKVKPVFDRLDPMPVITAEQLELAEFMRKRFHIGYADCFRLFLPPELRSGKVKDIFKYIIEISNINQLQEYKASLKKNATAQAGLIDFLIDNKDGVERSLLNKLFGSSALQKLKKLGLVQERTEHIKRTPYNNLDEAEKKNIKLTQLQQDAINTILADTNRSYLLHGITGSGKTEVYMNVIEDVLAKGKSALMLVP
ncbi:MAG: DEAD/DEAH box helicase family protein, partial [Clostridia bacterium]|nr:DEAD/DEAH box helicase family protein [Clostridia bacterium]